MDREAEMAEWSDGRLDDLSRRVDRIETKMDKGFADVERRLEKVDQRFREVERKVDDGFAQINAKFEQLHRMLFKAAWGLAIGLLGLVGVIAAQL